MNKKVIWWSIAALLVVVIIILVIICQVTQSRLNQTRLELIRTQYQLDQLKSRVILPDSGAQYHGPLPEDRQAPQAESPPFQPSRPANVGGLVE